MIEDVTSPVMDPGTGTLRVGRTLVETPAVNTGYVSVSTVHLGYAPPSHNTFETMVFKANDQGEVVRWMDLYVQQYHTLEEAVAGHAAVVGAVKAGRLHLRDLIEEDDA